MNEPNEYFVIDTSSIITVRRLIPNSDRKRVLLELDMLVESGALIYPVEVYDELDRYADPARTDDLPYNWTKKNKSHATRHGRCFGEVKDVLSKVPLILDPDKPSGVEEADPYVLGLALKLTAEGSIVTVVNDERKDRPDKISMTTACGILRLPALPLAAFLAVHEIWP